MKKHLLFSILFALPGLTFAGDWPKFRGPTGDGHSTATKVPVKWGPDEHVKWKVSAPEGWSSPILVDGKVYLTGTKAKSDDAKADRDLVALCLDAATGKTIWETNVFAQDGGSAPGIHKKNSHASPTPVIEGDRLYVHFGHQGSACLDLAGKVIWENRDITYKPVHGGGCSPVLVDDKMIFSCDGAKDPFIIALNKHTGKTEWKTQRTTKPNKSFSFSTPTLISYDGKRELISPASGGVFAYDPDTGKERWKVRYGEGYSVVPKPIFQHGLVFVSSGFDKAKLLAFKPGGSGDITETAIAWESEQSVPKTPSKLVVGKEIYWVSDGGIMICADAKTGEQHWRNRVCSNISASLVYAEGRIYLQDEKGLGVVLRASKHFKELAKNDLKERSLASVAVGDGMLLIRTADHLYRIGD